MAVAAPVLERTSITEEESEFTRESYMTPDERHNARISDNYRRLINPESTPRDIIPEAPVYSKRIIEFNSAPSVKVEEPVRKVSASPYRVENARADSKLFRADSVINRRAEAVAPVVMSAETEEEESEDLRPTPTTIQYKTAGLKKASEEGTIANNVTAKKARFSKKDKMVLVAVVCVIVALFVLIIVNSAVISNLNGDISTLQTSLTDAKLAYSSVNDEMRAYLNNLGQTVSDYAYGQGMVLR